MGVPNFGEGVDLVGTKSQIFPKNSFEGFPNEKERERTEENRKNEKKTEKEPKRMEKSGKEQKERKSMEKNEKERKNIQTS